MLSVKILFLNTAWCTVRMPADEAYSLSLEHRDKSRVDAKEHRDKRADVKLFETAEGYMTLRLTEVVAVFIEGDRAE